MKKTIQVNLGGQVFTLDEDAFEYLSKYLKEISRLYKDSPGREEILNDIEHRIAELFYEQLSDTQTVITIAQVEKVVEIMGRPEEFEAESTLDDESNTRSERARLKTFYRDTDNRVFGGVSSGIAHYFGIDPLIIRLGFVALVVLFGTGILFYLLLWLIVPEAKTTAEKLSMRGEAVNIGSIGKTIEDEFQELGGRLKDSDAINGFGARLANGLERLIFFLGDLIRKIFSGLAKIFGVVLLLIGSIASVVLIAVMIGQADMVHYSTGGYSSSFTMYEMGEAMFVGSNSFWVAAIGMFLFLAIPFIAMIYGGLRLVAPGVGLPYFGISLFGGWILGVILVAFSGFSMARDFSKEEEIQEEWVFESITSDTLTVNLGEDPFNIRAGKRYYSNRDQLVKIEESRITVGNVYFNVAIANEEDWSLNLSRSAHALSYELANERAENVIYEFQSDSNSITLNAAFSFPKSDQWRDQSVEVTLHAPIGKVVYLAPGSERIISNIPNVQNMHDPKMAGHYWLATSEGLSCIDCENNAKKISL